MLVRRGRSPPSRCCRSQSSQKRPSPSVPVRSSRTLNNPPTATTKSPPLVGCVPALPLIQTRAPLPSPRGGSGVQEVDRLFTENAYVGIRLQGFCRSMVVTSPMLRFATQSRLVPYPGAITAHYTPLVKGQAVVYDRLYDPLTNGV